MRAVLVGLGAEELVRRVRRRHRAAEGNVGDDAVDVDRHPGVVVDRFPGADQRALLRDAGGRGHERQPGVRDQHDRRADDVQAQAEQQVHLRRELPPAVVIGVEEEGLEEKQQYIWEKCQRKDAHQIVGELRVQDDQHEGQESAERAGERERDRQQLGELVRQAVVALVLGAEADELDDQREHRHREHEGGEQQVELRHDPDRDAAADLGELPILDFLVRELLVLLLLLRGLVRNPLIARCLL